MSASETSEFNIIRWIRSVTPPARNVPVGIGDDCAAIVLDCRRCLLKIDQTVEGIHFQAAAWRSMPEHVGRKALARPLSDIAAMAGKPLAAVISVLLPALFTAEDTRRLYTGMKGLADEFDTNIVGGDIACGGDRLVISVSVLGESNKRGDVTRSGARPGDALFVTGELGGSILGKHLTFTPRIREALELAEILPLHAMIDISDGLAADLQHVLDESGVGAVLRADSIPISEAARAVARQREGHPLDHALDDGEDYELLFTVPGPAAERVPKELASGVRVSCIGEITSAPGLWMEDASGRRAIQPKGWVHRVGAP
jgi:thiamine-monophosphate kinase